jgi:iron complex transport system substrate-binding protein
LKFEINIATALAATVITLLLPGQSGAGVLEWLPPAGPPKGDGGRIVSLAPSITEILFEIGAGKRIVGVTRYDDWPPAVKSIKRVGGYLDVDLETIISLKPEIVFCEPNSGIKSAVERLAETGVHVGVVRVNDVESIIRAVSEIGASIGNAAEAGKRAREMRSSLADVSARIAHLRPVRILIFFNVNPLMAAGKGTFTDSVISLAGGENLADDSPISYPIMDRERLSALDPDVIIDQSEAAMGTSGAIPYPSAVILGMKYLKAVGGGRVYSLPGNYLFRPGPRIIQGIETLAHALHPEAFGGALK